MGGLKVKVGKKNFVPTIVAIVLVALLIVAVVCFIVLFQPKPRTVTGKLSVPENLTVKKAETQNGFQYFVSYNPVEGADSYLVYINDEYTHQSTSTVVDITKYLNVPQEYTISVQAINNRISSYNSDLSTITYQNTAKLTTPRVTRTNETFLWSAVNNANSYNIELKYGNITREYQTENSSFDITSILNLTQNDPTITTFSLRVQAVYLGVLLWQNSEFSEKVDYVVVKNLEDMYATHFTTERIESDSIQTRHKISWTQCYGADSYEIYLSKNLEEYKKVKTVLSGEELIADLTDYLNGVGTYTAYVKAISNNEYTLSSQSNVVDFVVSQQIATPTILDATVNGEYMSVSWQAGDNKGLETYYYVMVSDGTNVVHDAQVVGTNYDFLLTVNRNGYYKITVVAKNQVDPLLYTDSKASNPVEKTVVATLNAPNGISYLQEKADNVSSLSWSAVENASGYVVCLYKQNGEEKQQFGDLIYVSSTSLNLPITEAGFYFAKVKTLASEGFYKDSEFSTFVECTYKTSLQAPTNVTFDSETVLLSWDEVENAFNYEIYINNELVSGVAFENVAGRVTLTNLETIFEDALKYPSSSTVPYTISVRAVGEENGLYASSSFVSVDYFLTRKLNAPTNLVYTQTPNTNKVVLSWDAVENASNGYCVYINGTAPVALQVVTDTKAEIGTFLLPGKNKIQVVANQCTNYDASSASTFETDPEFIYIMQSVENVKILSTVSQNSTTYKLSFDTHKYANYFMFTFFADEDLTQQVGRHIETVYYTNGETVTFDVDFEWIKRTGDCITYIQVLTAYETSFAGSVASNFDADYIVGDGVNLSYTKSATKVETYENETLLLAVSNARITNTTTNSASIEFEYLTVPINLSKVASFELVLITIDSVNGNSYAVPVYVDVSSKTASSNIGYYKFNYQFTNVGVGEYQIRIRALSSNTSKVAHSGFVYLSFSMSITQDTPANLTMYRSLETDTYGNVIMQWDAISNISATSPATYTAKLFFFNEETNSSTLIQEWTSVGYANKVVIRDGQTIRVVTINLSLARYTLEPTRVVEDFMKSGLYYFTVKANAISDYYLESAEATISRENYYQHDASLTPPTIALQDGNVFITYVDMVYYQLYYYTTSENELTAMNNLSYSLTLYNDVKSVKFDVASYFASGFNVGTYHIVAVAKRDISVDGVATTITSLKSNVVDFSVAYKFDATTIQSISFGYVNDVEQAKYVSNVTAVWDIVEATGSDGNNISATDYQITFSNSKTSYNKKFIIQLNTLTYAFLVKILNGETYDVYEPTRVQDGVYTYYVSGVKTFEISLLNSGTQMQFSVFNLNYLTSGLTYIYSVKTLGNESLFYQDSEMEAYSTFTYKTMWQTPTVAFANELREDIGTQYLELANGQGFSLHINPLIGENATYTGNWLFDVIATNLQTNSVLGFYSVSGFNIANVTGRIFDANSTITPDAGLYEIKVRIVNSLKVESLWSSPLYVYYSLQNSSPKIVKIAKASTFSYGDVNDIAIEWLYSGFDGIDNSNLSFTLTITETDENGNPVSAGFADSITIFKSDVSYENGKYSTIIELNLLANKADFFWSKTWGEAETITHYTFTIFANQFATNISAILQQIVDGGQEQANVVPSSSDKYSSENVSYIFNEQSSGFDYLVRRDNALNYPSNFELEIADTAKIISWENVSDPSGQDYEVGYKYVYYTVDKDKNYILHTNDGTNGFAVVFSGGSVIKQETSTEIVFSKNASNFWFSVAENTFEVDVSKSTIFGIWMFAYPLSETSLSSSSDIAFGLVSYAEQVLLPTEMLWEVSADNSTNTIYFENSASSQFNSTDVSLYKLLYSITIGGHQINWTDDASSLGNIVATLNEFSVVISGLYNLGLILENVDEYGNTINRQYQFEILANNYFMTVFNPNETGYESSMLLYLTNNVSGVVYKPVKIDRTVETANITSNNGSYFATFTEISSATKYELIFVNSSNEPLGTDTRYFMNATVPQNYVAKLSVQINQNDESCTYIENGKTQVGYISVDGEGLRTICVEISALLNGRPASTYYLAIYTIADVEKFITPKNSLTKASASFVYHKTYQAIDEDSILFTTDEQGLLKTISWAENQNPDGGWVYEGAYYKLTIWDTDYEGDNPVYYALDGSGNRFANFSISTQSGVGSITNLLNEDYFSFENTETLGARMVADVEQLFKTYLREDGVLKAGNYTIGLQILPVNTTTSSYEPSLVTTKSFVYKVKLEFESDVDYVSVMVDDCLNTTVAQTTHEIAYKNAEATAKAEAYLQNSIIAGNFNLKSLYVNSWLASTQSVALEVLMQNSSGNWVVCGQIEDVLTNKMILLSGSNTLSLVAGENRLAIRALGVNENYITSELKILDFVVYYKHNTPTIVVDTANTQYIDNGNTLSYISLKLDNVGVQNYDVVVNAYRIVNGQKVLAFSTPTDNENRLMWLGQEGRFVYKNTYSIAEKQNQTVNFLDFFKQNAGTEYGDSSLENYQMYSLIGAYDYVFTARIYASETESYMLNSSESDYSDTLTYTYKLATPTFSTTIGENGGYVNEFVQRDADQQITSAKIKIKLDNPNFKTIVNYSVTIWDINALGTRYIENDNDTMTYTASVQIYFNTLNQISYSLVAVSFANASGVINNVSSSIFNNYFTIEDGHLVFDLMLFIKNGSRENGYLAGVYQYNVRADSASNFYFNGTYYELSTNTNILASDYAYEFTNENEDEKYAQYFQYIHTVPYPVAISSAEVSENGILSITFQDTYKTALGFDIFVNDLSTTLSLENPNDNTLQTYSRDISNLLVVGQPNVVTVNVQEIGYYSAGKPITATLQFTIWTNEILKIKNLSWNAVSGTHQLSFDAEIYEIYLTDPRLNANGQNADRVHFALEISYLSNFDINSISGLSPAEAFTLFNQDSAVEKIVISNLANVDCAKFIAQTKSSYSFDLNKCIALIDESWLVSGSLRGGYYSLKLVATVKNEDGTFAEGTEYYKDTNSFIELKYILSPWQIASNINFWDEMGGVVAKTTTVATDEQKLTWAENTSAKWGVVFDVTSVKGSYPTEYKVYYVRDTRENAFDETYSFVVRGDNVQNEDGKAWLNLLPYFNSQLVPLAGVYSFVIKALSTPTVAEESAYIAFASETGKTIIGDAVSNVANFGLQHFVKLATPVLGDDLIKAEAQSAQIRISSALTVLETEEDLVEEYQLTNFRGEAFTDGQDYPTDAQSTGVGSVVGSGSFATYVHHDRANATLGLKYGNNFVSVKSKALGNLSLYYLDSDSSKLKCYNWEITLDAPTSVDFSLKQFTNGYQDSWQGKNLRTVPENDNINTNSSTESGVHTGTDNSAYTENVGGVRSQSQEFDTQNNINYQDYFVISATVSMRTAVIDNITRLEIRVFDPVTNLNQNYTQSIAHIIVKANASTGEVYFESMAEIGINAFHGSMVDMGNTVVGNCVVENDLLNIYVTKLKVYQLFPTVTYDRINVHGSEYDVDYIETYSGVKNYAKIPQTYTVLVNSLSNGISSVPTTITYDYSLRFITPEIVENGISFEGNAIATTLDGSVYIKDGVTVNSKDDYVVSITVDKISRNTKYIKLYAYVDQSGIKTYYDDIENSYFTNFTESYAKLNSSQYTFKMFDITSLVSFENEDSAFGSAVLTINASDTIWEFINKNTPNIFAFHVQAVTEAGATTDAAYSFTEHKGDLYAYTENAQTKVTAMLLRYSESYISKKATFTIKRQFVPAPIDIRFDVGQASDTSLITSLNDNAQSEIVNGTISNLHVTDGIALDPYLKVDENSYSSTITYNTGSATSKQSSLDYEYTETQKYGGYEIKISNGQTTSSVLTFKTVVSLVDGVVTTNLGLFQTVEKFDEIATTNPARYMFENDTFKNVSILEDYCLYNLFASVFQNKQGGVCTISVRAISSDNKKWVSNGEITDLKANLWVSQDENNWTQKDFVFYTRPDAVKLTLGQATFDSANPLAVRWGNETIENELLYPNNIPLSWTQSSSNFGSYTLDVTRADETTQQYQAQGGFKYSQNQGTNNFMQTSVNLANPNFTFTSAENSNYNADKNTYARFNYWDYMNGESSARISGEVVPYYNIVVQANGNKNLYVGKGYRSGATNDGLLSGITNYYMQLKYNIGTFVTKSTVSNATKTEEDDPNVINKYTINNLSTFDFTTKNKSGEATTITLKDEADHTKVYNFVERTYVTLTGPFSYTKNQQGQYEATEKTTDLLYSTDGWQNTKNYVEKFSVTGLKNAILDYLQHINAVGGKYTFQLHFSGGEQNVDQSQVTVAFIDSDESNIFEFEYYREVEDGELLIEDIVTFDNTSANLDLPTYGVKFSPKKNLEGYDKYIGEYSIVMEQTVPGANSSITPSKKTSDEIASFVAYNTIGEDEQSKGVLKTAYDAQEFNEAKADAMDNKAISEDDVEKFIKNGYTNNLGSLQGGVNTYIYTITAGDTKYNLPFAKKVTYTYSIPNNFIPNISTTVANVYSFVAELNKELEDYYENPGSQTITSGQNGVTGFSKNPASAINLDLYYTLHSAVMTGFLDKATVRYNYAYEIDWSFSYSAISLQKATQNQQEYQIYKINKHENQVPILSAGTALTIAGKSDIIYTNANDIASDAKDKNELIIDFAKNNKTTDTEELYAYKVENFTFTVKAKPGFASVFTTTAENGWSKDKDNKTIEGTVIKTFDNYSAKIAETKTKTVKFATLNIKSSTKIASNYYYTPTSWSDIKKEEQNVITNTSPLIAYDIGTSSSVSYKQEIKVETIYNALSAYNYSIASLNYTTNVFQQSTWTKTHKDYGGIVWDVYEHQHDSEQDRTLAVNVSLQNLLLNGKENIKTASSDAQNLRNRPNNTDPGWWGHDRYKDEMAYLSISSRQVSFMLTKTGDTTVEKSKETDANYIPLLHEQTGLISKFGFTKAENVVETEATKCETCKGTNYTKCDQCGGDGIFTYSGGVTGFCDKCMGTGQKPCTACQNGYAQVCSVCGGLTELVCQRCGGDGTIEFKKGFTTYWYNGEELTVPSSTYAAGTYITRERDRSVGCPDCGGSGTIYSTRVARMNEVYDYLYYDIDSGKLLRGEQTNEEAGRAIEVTAGSGIVKCYNCSGGINQNNKYNADGTLKSTTTTESTASASANAFGCASVQTSCGCNLNSSYNQCLNTSSYASVQSTSKSSLNFANNGCQNSLQSGCENCTANNFCNNVATNTAQSNTLQSGFDCNCGNCQNTDCSTLNSCGCNNNQADENATANNNAISVYTAENLQNNNLQQTAVVNANMKNIVEMQLENNGNNQQQKTPLQNAESVLMQAVLSKNKNAFLN